HVRIITGLAPAARYGIRLGARDERRQPRLALVLVTDVPVNDSVEPLAGHDTSPRHVPAAAARAAARYVRRLHGRSRRPRCGLTPGLRAVRRNRRWVGRRHRAARDR